ncbi:hypothetical protein [Nocardioides luteus]
MEIRADIEAMYRAGKIEFPAYAGRLSEVATTVAAQTPVWASEAAKAQSPPALTKAIELNDRITQLLTYAVQTWNDAAETVVAITDDFVATDEQAAVEAASLQRECPELARPFEPVAIPRSKGVGTR